VIQAGIPPIVHMAAASQALPVLAALRFRSQLPRARRWLLLWAGLQVCLDIVHLVAAEVSGSSAWIRMFATPISDSILLWALSIWQAHAFPRLTIRIIVPVYVVAWIAVTWWEGFADFGTYSEPLHSVLLLAVALYTLVSRSAAATESITRSDWFWVTFGLSLYFALGVALGPFSRVFFPSNPELVRQAYLFKAGADILAFVLVAVGMLCPIAPPSKPSSSGSSM
jgi:hypothetical protein